MLLAVMLAGLFMNAAIQNSFDTGGWAFVVPLLAIQAGRSILMVVAAPTRMLRQHYGRLLCWILATAPLWLAGAVVQAEPRLLGWAGAAVIDLAGTWLAHPCPAARSTPSTSSSTPTTCSSAAGCSCSSPWGIGPDLRHRPRRGSQGPC